jgi:serine/threonine protein kinase
MYSFTSDIWAIAVIMFELFKGYTPWKARSEQTLYSKMINEPI